MPHQGFQRFDCIGDHSMTFCSQPEGRRIDNSSETRYILPDSAGIVSYEITKQVNMESLVADSLKVYVQITGK